MLRIAAYQPDIAPNLASMIRTAACLGVAVDVIGPCGFPFSVKAYRRTVMDYEERADVTQHVDWPAFQRDRPAGRLVLLTTAGDAGLWDHGFLPGDTLLLGRETAGVPPEVAASADAALRIPMAGQARSLNVTIAAAIAMAEALRQLSRNVTTA